MSLPIIAIYLLGDVLDNGSPRDAVPGETAESTAPHEFIEQLPHDALFIQIFKIEGDAGSRLERILMVFDQHRRIEGDAHRLALQGELGHSDPVEERMLRILNRLQESPEREQLMSLEDVYQLEQEQLTQELEATRQALPQEQARREEETRRLEEESRRRETAERVVERLRKLLGDQSQA